MRRRTGLDLVLIVLWPGVLGACNHLLPWMADWKKPGASDEDRRAAVEWCRGSAASNPPQTAAERIAEHDEPGSAPPKTIRPGYAADFNRCMERLGWER